MITANFFHIKNTNGLFYYGIDYLKSNSDLIRGILVRPSLEQKMKEALPNIKIIPCSLTRYICEIRAANLKGDLIYTPSPHPLPLIDRQWIVLHDAYPFETGFISVMKRLMLSWSLSLSKCIVGYINSSESEPFVRKLGVPDSRMIFAPNRFPEPVHITKKPFSVSGRTTIGLLGTDSKKKNYSSLFTTVMQANLSSRFQFLIYGHDTSYFRDICICFPEIQIELVESDHQCLDSFMNRIDVLVSAAEKEGFGRPIAAALLAGLPVELLDRPVFREFYSGGARFHSDISTLLQSVLQRSGDSCMCAAYKVPTSLVESYNSAIQKIRLLGSATVI